MSLETKSFDQHESEILLRTRTCFELFVSSEVCFAKTGSSGEFGQGQNVDSRCENRKLYTPCCVIKTAKNKLKNKSGIIHDFERSSDLSARKNGQGRLS